MIGNIFSIFISSCFIAVIFKIVNLERSEDVNRKISPLNKFVVRLPEIERFCCNLNALVSFFLFVLVTIRVTQNLHQITLLYVFLYLLIILMMYLSLIPYHRKLEINNKSLIFKRFLREDIFFNFTDIDKADQTYGKITIYLYNGFKFIVKKNSDYYHLFAYRLETEDVNLIKEGMESKHCYTIFAGIERIKKYRIITCVFGFMIFISLTAIIIHINFLIVFFILALIELVFCFIYFVIKYFKIIVNYDTITVKRLFKEDVSFNFKFIDYVRINQIGQKIDNITNGFVYSALLSNLGDHNITNITNFNFNDSSELLIHYTVYLKDGSKFKFTNTQSCYGLFLKDLVANNIKTYDKIQKKA